MNYHPDDFLALVEEAEQQGGSHLSEPCNPGSFRLNLPLDEDNPNDKRVSKRVYTTGCKRHTKFLVPLLPDAYFLSHDYLDTDITLAIEEEGGSITRPAEESDFDFDDDEFKQAVMGDGSPELTTVCAIDDAMGLWPRFQDTMHTGKSFQEGI